MDVIKWPSWRYGARGEAAIFEKQEDVPAGWQDTPAAFEGVANADLPAPDPAPAEAFDRAAAPDPVVDPAPAAPDPAPADPAPATKPVLKVKG